MWAIRKTRPIAIAVAGWLLAAVPSIAQPPVADIISPPADAPAIAVDAPPTGPAGRLYGNVDYMLFVFRDGPAPPLIQVLPTSAFNANPPDASKAITIFGDGIREHSINGLNLELGYWLGDRSAIEASFTQFETKSKRFFLESNGEPSIGRYYIDLTNTNRPLTYLYYSNPNGSTSGYINAEAPVRMWTTDVNVRTQGLSVFSEHTDYLFGFRYVDLRDSIVISDYTQANDGSGISISGLDSFAARNQFYGPQVGVNSWFELGCGFNIDLTGKLAMGGVDQQAFINGNTIERVNGVVTRVVAGDVLAQPTNIGNYQRSRFAVVPELAIKLGYQATSRLSFTLGYDLLAVSSVVRAGSTIDAGVNPNVNPLLPTQTQSSIQRPGFGFNGTDFWAQGLTLGMSLKY